MPGPCGASRLRLIQLVLAGAESVLPHVPPGVTLANARGVHDPSVAEWITAVILAQVRWLPRFMAAQAERTWDFALSEPLCGKTVLIVGYGSIGSALDARLRACEAETVGWRGAPSRQRAWRPRRAVLRRPRHRRPADAAHAGDTRPVDARRLALLPDGALVVNVGRGQVLDTGAMVAEAVRQAPRGTRRHRS